MIGEWLNAGVFFRVMDNKFICGKLKKKIREGILLIMHHQVYLKGVERFISNLSWDGEAQQCGHHERSALAMWN